MIKLLKSKIEMLLGMINQGQERSVKAKWNIIYGTLIKGTGILISFILVPLAINYVTDDIYGIWLTLSEIVVWFSFFDVGLTQGLRNKFAEAIAVGDNEKAQIYVSTTYGILGIIFFFVWLLFLYANQFISWSNFLHFPAELEDEVSLTAIVIFTYFCIQFVIRVITTILMATQEPAKSSLLDVLGQVFSLIFIVTLINTTSGSLLYLSLALCVSPLVVLLGANIILFNGKFKQFRPRFSKIRFSEAKGLFNLGVVFFIIQIAALIQYETANIIISRNFGTAEVTSYGIVYKYFGALKMAFAIFLVPFWSAVTEAYVKNDITWIKNAIKKYNRLGLLLVAGGVVMLLISDPFYDFWIGEGNVNITFALSFWGFMYFAQVVMTDKYVMFLNGISALRVQFIASLLSPVMYIGIVLLLIRQFGFGVHAVFIASFIANFYGMVIAPIQYHLIVNKNKRGIWVK